VAEWPPLLVYAVIAGSVVIENFFPPSPSDVFVLLAAFLSHRGVLEPETIFLVAWGFGCLGAVAVYASTRHFGRRFLQTPLGRRLISPGAFASVEREYLRFGVAGMFVLRLLPAFRAVVAPFAGFMNLGPRRALLPIALASGAWYGGLTLLGSAVGAQWETIRGVFGRVNRGLGIAAVAALVLLVLWILRRRREVRRIRLAALTPFEPLHPERPAPMVEGLPVISPQELEAAREAEREKDATP
jgi:membrane protein DedA with SNARE-associated domain